MVKIRIREKCPKRRCYKRSSGHITDMVITTGSVACHQCPNFVERNENYYIVCDTVLDNKFRVDQRMRTFKMRRINEQR